ISDSKRVFFTGRPRPWGRRAWPSAPPSWPCSSTASTGRRPSAAGATTGQLRRWAERAGRFDGRAAGAAGFFARPPGNKYGPQHVIKGMSLADPAASGLPPTNAEHLPDDVATLKRMVLELLASLHERDRDIEGVRHRINLLLRRLYGPRGERI